MFKIYQAILLLIALKVAVYFQSNPGALIQIGILSVLSLVYFDSELNFTKLFNRAVLLVNAYFKLLCFNNFNKNTKQHVIKIR